MMKTLMALLHTAEQTYNLQAAAAAFFKLRMRDERALSHTPI